MNTIISREKYKAKKLMQKRITIAFIFIIFLLLGGMKYV